MESHYPPPLVSERRGERGVESHYPLLLQVRRPAKALRSSPEVGKLLAALLAIPVCMVIPCLWRRLKFTTALRL